jgi:hypothetical protein
MSSLTAFWNALVARIPFRGDSLGTRWVQPQNWVTRAIEQPVPAPVIKPVTASPAAAPASTESPTTKPGQAA